jgi:hypothetical protein
MDIDNDGRQTQQGGPPPPPPPDAGAAAPRHEEADLLRLRMDRAEALIVDLQRRAGEAEEALRATRPAAVTPGAEAPAAAGGALRGGASRQEELAARLELAESSLSGLKTAFEGQRARLEGELDAVAQKDSVEALRVNLAAALSALDGMRLNLAQYADELAASRSECRKALGEAQGLTRVAAQNQASGQLDAFVRDSVGRLGARLAELETAMHAGLSELSARFTANEVLYGKMFSSAEERLKKGLEPQLKRVEGELRWLRENLLRLSDDYTVVAERKIRALEAKYSAFEAISKRMDAIDAALRMGAKKGSD